MRYQPEHKEEIREKIVLDAARRVRAEGIAGATVATVMKDAGLTHGGFYKHFKSKEQLLVEALHQGFAEIEGRLTAAAQREGKENAWKAIVRSYLDPEHCDDPEHGCPLAALAPDLARASAPMKGPIVAELVGYKNRLVPYMPGRRTADKEKAFFAMMATMSGAIALARILPDKAVRARILGAAKDHLLASY